MDNDIINVFCNANLERQRKLYRAEFNAIGLKYKLLPTPFYTVKQGNAIEGTIDFVMLIEKYYKIVAPFENDLRALYEHYKDTDNVNANVAIWAYRICEKYHDINPTQATPPQVATLPKWAQSTEGAQILNKLAEAGFCTISGNVYQWQNAKTTFAYFVEIVSDKLNLRKSNGRFDWVLIASAFDNITAKNIRVCQSHLSKVKNEYATKPVDYDTLKALIEK